MRTAILYSGSQLGNAFGGLFAIAILNLDGTSGLEGWRWVSFCPLLNRFCHEAHNLVIALSNRRSHHCRSRHHLCTDITQLDPQS